MKTFAAVIAVLLCTGTIQANIIPVLDNITPNGTNWDWTYRVTVTNDQDARPGNFFTLFDFEDIVSVAPIAGWSSSTQYLGVVAPRTLPVDDPARLNVTWTRTGPTIVGMSLLGMFTVTSASNEPGTSFFTGLGTKNSGAEAGSQLGNVGLVAVPGGNEGPNILTPEPGTDLAIGTGLVLLGLLRRRLAR